MNNEPTNPVILEVIESVKRIFDRLDRFELEQETIKAEMAVLRNRVARKVG